MKDITPNRGGTGSTYGGTQSPDPDAADGYQKPSEAGKAGGSDKTQPETDLGQEYDDDSSYGSDGGNQAKGGEGDTGNAEEGSPVR